MKLRKKSVIFFLILIIAAGSFFWVMNSPKYCLKPADIKLYSKTKVISNDVFINDKPIPRDEEEKGEFADRPSGFEKYFEPQPGHWEHTDIVTVISKNISGMLTNRSTREFSDINIKFAIFDSNKYQIGTFNVHIDNLQPHKTCKFDEVLYKQPFDDNVTYSCEIIKITAK